MVFSILFGLFGLAVLLGIAWVFSNNKRAINWQLIGTGVTLQIAFASFVLLGNRMVAWVQSWLPVSEAAWKQTALVMGCVAVALLLLPWLLGLVNSQRTAGPLDALLRRIGL